MTEPMHDDVPEIRQASDILHDKLEGADHAGNSTLESLVPEGVEILVAE